MYVKDHFCMGLPPARIARSSLFGRNSLVSKMMLERQKVRLLCAPSMMGKTSLAYLYAQTVRSFENVFWFEAHHPYILRNVEDDTLLNEMLQIAGNGGLAVFEDVPRLDESRKRGFIAVCEGLINAGIEVIVTCIPSSNPFNDSKDLCMVLDSNDLLYSDDEFYELRLRGYLPPDYRSSSCKAERIPGLLNRPVGSVERYMILQEKESENAKDVLLTYAMVLLGSGSFEDLSYVMGKSITSKDVREVEMRPYATIFDFGRCFSADGFPINEVLRVLNSRIPYLISSSDDLIADDYMGRIADVLFAHRFLDRAARIIMESCESSYRTSWVTRYAEEMIRRCAPLHVVLICRGLDKADLERQKALRYYEALALHLIGEDKQLEQGLTNLVKDDAIDLKLRLRCASLIMLSRGDKRSQVGWTGLLDDACLKARRKGVSGDPLLDLWNSLLEGDSGINELCKYIGKHDRYVDWGLACACCLRFIRISVSSESPQSINLQMLSSFIEDVQEEIEACVRQGALDSWWYLVKRELDCFRLPRSWSRDASSYFDRMDARIRSQRLGYKKISPSSDSLLAYRGSMRNQAAKLASNTVMSVPVLNVRMFGRFEATIGDEPVERQKLSRQKVRSLLVILALDAGKDLSCDRLAKALWSESLPSKARRNFYSIFSILRHALMLPDGSCPYLSRVHGVCRLNSLYLQSDVEEIKEICQQLRFARLSTEDAYALLERLGNAYQGELLPGEDEISLIESARMMWRTKVVDSVLAAAYGLRDRGEAAASLDFANFAMKCDEDREDVYELLMILQYERKQRAGAIDTFQSYRRSNMRLGLDASERMMELYEGILNDSLEPDRQRVMA